MTNLANVLVIAAAYLLGSIPVGMWLVRVRTGYDVRRIGSGRTGGTNVLRAAGPWMALLTILGDGAKGFLAVWLARTLVGTPTAEALAGLLAVVGHNYPISTGFRGGAGTVTTVGGAFGLWPWSGAILTVIGGAAIVTTHYASLGSIVIALLLPITMALRVWLAGTSWTYLIYGLGTSALTLWALRPNIRRLLQGCERQVSLRNGS